jgi:hypothetical protein
MPRRQFIERIAEFAADADPVFRGAFEEIEIAGRSVPQRAQQGPPQA